MGLDMPETIFAHGWWLVGRDKMSKTAGNVVNPMEFAEQYGVDPFRYFLMAEMSLGQDASFTEDAFIRRYNAELANDLGNMLNRVIKQIATNFGGIMPECGELGEEEIQLRDVTVKAANDMVDFVGRMRLDLGLAELAGAVREANRYIEKRQPWTLAKQGEAARAELGTVLYTASEALRIISGMLYPTMPSKMSELRQVLGCAGGDPEFASLSVWGGLESGVAIGEMRSLFPRIDRKKVDAKGAQKKSKQNSSSKKQGVALIEFTDFTKVELRTAEVVEAEKVEGADKLLKLQIMVGEEKRQIIAGVAKYYAPEDLIGKTIIVVANLKPATIRGVESNGMLLAASKGKKLTLVTVDGEIPCGAKVG
jgi:methionyl-tRNA synthetase